MAWSSTDEQTTMKACLQSNRLTMKEEGSPTCASYPPPGLTARRLALGFCLAFCGRCWTKTWQLFVKTAASACL